MSHFTVVIVGDDVEGQLAPYDENLEVAPYRSYEQLDSLYRRYHETTSLKSRPTRKKLVEWANEEYGEDSSETYYLDEKGVYTMSTYSPNSKWDWWTIGGRWRGFFKLKEAAAGALGDSGVFDNEPLHDADVARKGDIDIEWMRDQAGKSAGEMFDMAHRVFEGTPIPESWETIRKRFGEERVDEAREAYHAQPRCKVVVEHNKKAYQEDRHEDSIGGFLGPHVETFNVSREVYMHRASDTALSPYAYVKDGEWFAPGNMGWWGTSSDEELDRVRFQRRFNEMLDVLDDDAILTLCDLHI